MLAVLPFENLTGDATQDYFSDGLTEEMIARVGNLDPQHLGVIARTSVMHYKHTQEPLDRIGRELRVQYVMEGSVRRDSDKIRITAQLIQVKDQSHLWARQYDRQLSSLLAVQGEIAQDVADEIQSALGEHPRVDRARQSALSTDALEAYDLYPVSYTHLDVYKRQILSPSRAKSWFAYADVKRFAGAWSSSANSVWGGAGVPPVVPT